MSTEAPAHSDTRPAVSVVVPSHNHAPFVAASLRSVIKQTQAPAELIVIDDGSTDGSQEIIARTLSGCPFPAELVARENRGLSATLNEGLARSRGDYFAYLGSDDLWLPGFVEARVALLEARPGAVLAYGHVYLIDDGGGVFDCTADWAAYPDGDARPMLLQAHAPMSPTVMYRRAALARHGWDEGARLEDYDLYLRLAPDGDFAFDPRVLAAWRFHGANTSRDQTFMLEEQVRALRKNAPLLGVAGRDLEKLLASVRFKRAEDFLLAGERARALSLVARNLRGAARVGPRAALRVLLRLLAPHALVRRRRQHVSRRNRERYGAIRF